MKIVFVSYEYLPDTGQGGIATYVWNAARMLALAGHHVEVACGSPTRSGTKVEDGVIVHRIFTGAKGGRDFGPLAAAALKSRYRAIDGFDVIESPEFNAEGAEFAQAHPSVALVVKLHTPSFLLGKLNKSKFGIVAKTRFGLGAIRIGQWPRFPSRPDLGRYWDFEKQLALVADRVAAPSSDVARIVGTEWQIPSGRMSVFPLPFQSPGDLGGVSLPQTGAGKNIVFIGRLEPRKGVQLMGRAFGIVKRRFPDASLRCVGQVCQSPIAGMAMDQYIRKHAAVRSSDIEFPGPVARKELANELARADICVFPSLWESFGYVCLEAMTAARAIVASSSGGMAEMLADGAGVLLEPSSSACWAEALCELLADGEKRRLLGQKARSRVQSDYCFEKILPQQISCYQQAIEVRQAIGPRSFGEIPQRPA